jgi:hypothetical protein
MAYYHFGNYYEQITNAAFSTIQTPGSATPHSGIYRCEGSGHEITSVENHVLPPQNHHQHSAGQGAIRSRLIAATKHNH